MIPLNKSCFTDYSTDLPDPNITKGINENIKVLDIDTIIFISLNGDELILRDVLYISELSYSLLSLDRLIMVGNIILFNDPHCIIENNIEFRIKSKFALIFDIITFLLHFHVDFSVAEFNLAINEDQIALWHAHVGHVAIFDLSHIAKVTIVSENLQTAISGVFPNLGICEPYLEGKQT